MSRVYKGRDGIYRIDFNDASGRRHRRKVGPVKRIAEEILIDVLAKTARQEWLGQIEDPKTSFRDFVKIWCDRILPTLRPGTRLRWEGIVRNHLKPAFNGSLRAIDLGAVEKYIAQRLEADASPACINREVGVLRHILKRACAWNNENGSKYLNRYPLAGWKPLQEPSGRTRFLDEHEIAQLLEACEESRSPYLKPFVLVALNTGMRRGEILNLTRKDINWVRRTATLTTSKNGRGRVVPLNDTAYQALRSLPARLGDAKLFPFKDDHSVSRTFRRVVQRAGIENLVLHSLRHTFASHQAMAGTPGRGLQALLGHRDARMTQRYSHLTDQYLHDAVNRVNLGASQPADDTAKKTENQAS